jgi:isoquinoline 1-oxidoreductase beta subunit
LQAVAKAADWDKPLPAGVFRGIGQTDGYGSHTACVCEVSVNAKGEVRIHRIVIGIDPGYAVNPDNIQAQLQGSVVHGLSAIFWGEMTVKDGRIEQSNFHDYRLMRMNEMPKVQTVIAPSGGFWGGLQGRGNVVHSSPTVKVTVSIFAWASTSRTSTVRL